MDIVMSADGDDAVVAANLAERLIESLLPGLELLSIEFGRRLGLYEALGRADDATIEEFAAAAGIDRRIAQEWLEQQTAAGFLTVDDASAAAAVRRFALPAAHRPVFLDPDDPFYAVGTGTMFAGTASAFDAVVDAARTGAGVRYGAFGTGVRQGLEQLNRPGYVNDLDGWVAALPDVRDRLRRGGRILDLGAGTGWSSVALARAFPAARVVAVDLDPASVADARRLVHAEGLDERIEVRRANATVPEDFADLAPEGFDLVTVFEALHDMNEPVAALTVARSLLRDGGAVLIGDEKVADAFTEQADFLDRLNYAFSVLHCLPATMAEGERVANGTVLRAGTVRDWAAEAGFGGSTVLPIEHPLWRFYRLDPQAR
ncbi:class I SAM-dependent methyltransferase [Microbacterium bovistercoris]|uniref:Class I SAM-dependent methyltransferase n=1 Tax=Microbacterium bovistercoris TaxID=2293570 RepID=A0A371NQW1_9MICO|nr:class I SAM-dependent methyltransferase [Microbacterium bovistercoris]REJ04558.1 class I SAM-dependent methyltransferase [Microbacterium bovistercoris]